MKITVINGPNINMLGIREPKLYGTENYAALKKLLSDTANEQGIEIEEFQSNCEGEIVTEIQSLLGKTDGIVINAAAYTHTSIAILDALKAVNIPTAEVHITDITAREEFRKISFVGMYALKCFSGQGIAGYKNAVLFLKEYLSR